MPSREETTLKMKDIIAIWIYINSIIWIIFSFGTFAETTTPLSASCVQGSQQTALPNCNHFLNFGNTCPYLSTDQEWKQCICNQDYINSLFGCDFPSFRPTHR